MTNGLCDTPEAELTQRRAAQHRSELAPVAHPATMDEMAAGLDHELNQPLDAISNFAQGAIRQLEAGGLDRDALLGVLRDIAQESQRAAEIIRGLMVHRAVTSDAANRARQASRPDIGPQRALLTPREQEVMDLLVQGKSVKQIAVELGVGFPTAARHRSRVLEKMHVDNDVELVRLVLLDAEC